MKKGNISLLMAFLLFLGVVAVMFTTVITNTYNEINANKAISRTILTGNDEKDMFKALFHNQINQKVVLAGTDAITKEDLMYIKNNMDAQFGKNFIITTNSQVVDSLRNKGGVVRVEDGSRAVTYSVSGFETQGTVKDTGVLNEDGSKKMDTYYIISTDSCIFSVQEEFVK